MHSVVSEGSVRQNQDPQDIIVDLERDELSGGVNLSVIEQR